MGDAEIELRAAHRHIRTALERAEEKQREADNAWRMVEGARKRCATAQHALALKRFGVGLFGPKGKRLAKVKK